ncbi:MAG: hypothetical protein LBU25_11785 [Treponema sp.]|nr:hypothetical protein [Treponema sp.]
MISIKGYAETFPGLKGRMEDTTTILEAPCIRDDFRVVGLKAGVPFVLEQSGDPGSGVRVYRFDLRVYRHPWGIFPSPKALPRSAWQLF